MQQRDFRPKQPIQGRREVELAQDCPWNQTNWKSREGQIQKKNWNKSDFGEREKKIPMTARPSGCWTASPGKDCFTYFMIYSDSYIDILVPFLLLDILKHAMMWWQFVDDRQVSWTLNSTSLSPCSGINRIGIQSQRTHNCWTFMI